MSATNPYAAPEAPLTEVAAPEAPYFATSTSRFVLLSVATGGLYELYWFYENWRRERERGPEDLMPFWRAVFAPIWCFAWVASVRDAADGARVSAAALSPAILGSVYLLFSVVWRLPDPYWLVSYLTVLPLLPVNAAGARLNEVLAPTARALSPWTVRSVIAFVVLAPISLLGILATLFPDAFPAE